MKKIIYSNYTKFIAVVLFITSIVLGALTVTNGIAEYGNEKEVIYRFENDFSEARHFSHLLDAPESAIFNAYHSYSKVAKIPSFLKHLLRNKDKYSLQSSIH